METKGMAKMIKNAFAEAYLALAREKLLKKISVSELASYCGLSRSTFYHHFGEKYELLLWVYTGRFGNTSEEFKDYNRWALKIADFFSENGSFFIQAYRYTDFLNWHKQWIYQNICDFIEHEYGKQELTDTMKYQIQSYI